MKFRSQIHGLAHVSQTGPYTLREETLAILHNRHRELVDSLEGTKAKHSFTPNILLYDDSLKKLFNYSVFGNFKSLSLA